MTLASVDDCLARHGDLLDTSTVHVAPGAIDDCYAPLADELGTGKWLVAADPNTWDAAGRRLTEVLDAVDQPWERFEITAQPEWDHPVCTDELVSSCQATMNDRGCHAGVAVGSGTVNDVVKMASHNLDRPMAVVGTAPSMNGYTSGVAAILSEGVKTTHSCTAPRAVVADLDVMAEAPLRMLASGFGDLLSKPVSNADWSIASELMGTPLSDDAIEIIEAAEDALEGVAAGLPERDRDAVSGLVEALLLSGFSMTVAGSSSPASGGEHLVSHYIDMTGYTHDLPRDLHGCQVGVGTLVAAHLYGKLADFDPAGLDIDARVDALAPWEEYRATLEARFGPLFDAVVEHARPKYPSKSELRGRLEAIVANWEDLMERASRTLRSRESIEEDLRAAGAPVRFEQLGVDRDRAADAIFHSKDIRDRYTVLDFCWEIGRLEDWGEEALELLEQ